MSEHDPENDKAGRGGGDDQHGHGEHERPPHIVIFIDEASYRLEVAAMTGTQLKQLAGRPEDYQLFLERKGQADEPIANDQIVQLKDGEHFHTVPPAQFG